MTMLTLMKQSINASLNKNHIHLKVLSHSTAHGVCSPITLFTTYFSPIHSFHKYY